MALYEGLYGQRPFRAKNRRALEAMILKGLVETAPRGSKVPPWIQRVLARGLAVHPEERWPSMSALLEQLSRDPVARRRRVALIVGVSAVILGGGGLGLRAWTEHVRAEARRCTAAADQLTGVWDVERAAEVEAAFTATDLVYASDTWTRTRPVLDRYRDEWIAMHTEACLANRRGEQSDSLLDRRMSCLAERRAELGAVVEALTTADAKAVENAVQAASSLGPLSRCADVGALQATVPPPDDPATRAAVASLRERVATVRADAATGRLKQAAATATTLLEEAEALGYEPLLAEALVARGYALELSGDYKGAGEVIERAFWTADAAGHDALRAETIALLIQVLGVRAQRRDGLGFWIRGAPAVIERAGSPKRPRYLLALALGGLAFYRGEHEEALTQFTRALEFIEGEAERSYLFADVTNKSDPRP